MLISVQYHLGMKGFGGLFFSSLLNLASLALYFPRFLAGYSRSVIL